MIDPKTTIHLTLPAHQQGPTDPCATFSLHKPGSVFSTLKTFFETLVHCLPSVDLTEINSFLVSPVLVPLPLGFVSSEWQNLVCLGPQIQVPLHRCAQLCHQYVLMTVFSRSCVPLQ